MAKVSLPFQFRNLIQEQATLVIDGSTVREVLHNLFARYPVLKELIINDDGGLQRVLYIYVEDENIQFGKHFQTLVRFDDKLSIIPALAGV